MKPRNQARDAARRFGGTPPPPFYIDGLSEDNEGGGTGIEQFETFVVSGCRWSDGYDKDPYEPDHNIVTNGGTGIEQCSDVEAIWWSVYGVDKNHLLQCIADFPAKRFADAFAALMRLVRKHM